MDSETALELVRNGATLLLLDVPQFTIFGIDTQMFSVGPLFKGVKMIPPGPHFVYYSSSSRDGNEFSPVVGFFINACPSEIVVRKWNQQEERLIRLSEEEAERYSTAVRNLEFDRHLGPYSLNNYGDWKRISNYITKSTIERIEPIGGDISVSYETGVVDSVPQSAMEKALAEQLRKSKFSESARKVDKRRCYYTSIPRVIKDKGIPGDKRTYLNLDKTQFLETIITKEYGGEEDLLLGELQLAYIAFLMGQSLEAFFQWKALIDLLFSCTEAPFSTRSQLFIKFIRVLFYQLKYGLRQDMKHHIGAAAGAYVVLDDSWLYKDCFLHRLFKEFLFLVQEASVVDGDLLSWTRKLKELFENSLGWEFQQNSALDGLHFEEDDEFAPVVVMPDEAA